MLVNKAQRAVCHYVALFVSAVTSPTEEQQLKQIWSEVNVGANGFLDKNELSVCLFVNILAWKEWMKM